MNSAKVAGGFPAALHLRVVPHEPVRQVPLPFESKLQPVRAQILPDHPTGALNTIDWPCFKVKPPPSKDSPGVTAGHIVSLQSFLMVKILAASVFLQLPVN